METLSWCLQGRKPGQVGTAVYMIDKLALRVGNEKDTEEAADTVTPTRRKAFYSVVKSSPFGVE